jgi:hypothetical protein
MSSSSEHKRSSDSSAAVVTPEKSVKKQRRTDESSPPNHDDSGVTAETVMGFESHPYDSNGEIMKNHHGFVVWAKKKSADGDAQGRLEDFVNWVESPEGQKLELEIEGNAKFTFGQHKGETFAQVSQNDPGYHGRYLHMLRQKGEEPNGLLSRYISWFQKKGYTVPSFTAARRHAATSRRVELGSECFESGGHRGRTFSWVARNDPSYHLRCEATGYNPEGMESYREYFAQYGDPYTAARGARDAIACAMGIPFLDDDYYDDDDDE